MSPGERHRAQAASFGTAAAAYERGRPPYPPEAIDWLLPEGAAHVLGVGAGTGKLTRQLLGHGLEVTAVEPSEGMREQLREAVPGATVLAGTIRAAIRPGRCSAGPTPSLHGSGSGEAFSSISTTIRKRPRQRMRGG